ncbi:MAG: AMP-dependent synthetase [Desulfobacteraceae bacterium]|nr:MAG: AMP-dependent synthetase [Desulfobacteraceae bacterium]
MKANSVYEKRPWLGFYPKDVPADIEVPRKSVVQAFNDSTEKWRDRTAIIFYGARITYGDLREKVDRFATALSGLGIKKGDVVAFLMLNSPEHIIAFYATIKLGAIVTPVSPVYVSSEIKHQLKDSGAETIICQDILYEAVEKTGIKLKNVILTNISESLPRLKKLMGKSVLRGVYQKMAAPSVETLSQKGFYQMQELIKKYPPDAPEVDINPEEDVMNLPYTGGTTGQPKGVMITHRGVIANDIQYHSFYPFLEDGEEMIVAYMPFYHAGGQFTALLSGIMRGATLVVITNPDPDDVLGAVAKNGATMFVGAPAMYELLKDYEKTDRVDWKRLKIIASGADALNERTARDWEARTGTQLHDIYGQTELFALSHGTPLGKQKIGTVGIPLPSTIAGILDPEKDEFMDFGELGEICVRFDCSQVCKGYWKNPEATEDCLATIDGQKWWRTGDLGRMDDDGYFHIYDRKRDLIKYKGLRIYAREVEEVLRNHPLIKEAGVIGVPDIKVGENVKAMVVLESDGRGNLSEEDIIAYCKDKLTPYKIPRIIEFVGEIPRTDVGKVSRRELREEEL